MKSSVYVETSVISYLTGHPSRDVIVAGRQALTVEWWGSCRQRFDVFVSAFVVAEAEDGDPTAAQKRLGAIDGIPALDVSDEAKELARQLVDGGPIPKEYPEDALHIAVCVLNGMDYLVAWNCTHLANATIRRQVERFLEAAGYVMPCHLYPTRTDGGMTMFKDPIVEEVRAARQRHASRFNNDLNAIVADMRGRQAHMDRPIVSLAPKRPMKKAS